jgi:hypothetical protein
MSGSRKAKQSSNETGAGLDAGTRGTASRYPHAHPENCQGCGKLLVRIEQGSTRKLDLRSLQRGRAS